MSLPWLRGGQVRGTEEDRDHKKAENKDKHLLST